MEARHLNGIAKDNRLVNLVWGSREENLKDKRRHNAVVRKLSFEKAEQIRYRHAAGEKAAALARAYGVSRAAVGAVLAGRTYRP